MKVLKEMIISVLIISLIIAGNVFTQNYTKETVENANEKIENLRECVKNKSDSKEVEEALNELDNYWQDREKFMSYYIEHDELEKVKTELVAVESNIELEEYEDAIEKMDKSAFLLDHIKYKESFNLKNIF